MKAKTARVKNIKRLLTAYDALETADDGIERMGLVYGIPGAGKTHALTWLALQKNAIYLRAMTTWTPSSMLVKIMAEIGQPAKRSANENVDLIIRYMAEESRPLFIDEIDMFTISSIRPAQAGQIIETLRSIHDASGMPVLMVGMKGVEIELRRFPQVTRRITQTVNFLPADWEDVRLLADTLCEVEIKDDLLNTLHEKAAGNIGLMTVGLSKIERAAKATSLKTVGLAEWGGRSFDLNGTVNGGSHGD